MLLGSGFTVQPWGNQRPLHSKNGLGFRVQGSGFRVGFRVLGLGLRV